MNIGIDIDGVLTNDDDYMMDATTKYVFENKLEGFEDPYSYGNKKIKGRRKSYIYYYFKA